MLNRVERHDQKGTDLIAERDSVTGLYYLYHRLAWYDKPGAFVEFNRPYGGKYQARLIIQMPVGTDFGAEGDAQLAAGSLTLNGLSLGQPASSRFLSDGDKRYLYAAFNLDDPLSTGLRQAMLDGKLTLTLDPPPADTPPYQLPSQMTAILRDMLDARADLK